MIDTIPAYAAVPLAVVLWALWLGPYALAALRRRNHDQEK